MDLKRILLVALLCTAQMVCLAQEKWELKKDKDGIAVYTGRLNNEKFKRIKVICEINATTEQLVKVLQNVSHHVDWIYNTKRAYIISHTRDTMVYYSETSLPWPVSNRDLVIRQCFYRDSITKSLKVEARSVNNMVPLKTDLVRVPYSLGIWQVNTLPNRHIKVEYTFSVDPGGAIPAWVVNFMATAGPFNTFKSLKDLLEKKKT